MTKTEIIKKIVEETGVSRKDASAVIESFMVQVKDAVANGKEVTMRGFGTFTTKTRAAKTARNISKNTSILIPKRVIPHFKAAEDFKDIVDEAYNNREK